MTVRELKTQGGVPEASQTGRALLSLREMLFRGDVLPGERISELPMVARLGVSRTPIRLALDRLAHEGLLEALPTGGFTVRSFSLADIWDAIEMRGVLEGTASRLAAERLTDDSELAELRRIREEMCAYGGPTSNIDSYARYLDLNDAFHAEIVRLAKSPMLKRSLDQLLTLPFAQPSAVVFVASKLPGSEATFAISQEHHRIILDAIEHRQGTRAEAAAREHSTVSRRILEGVLENQEVLNSVPGASLIRLPSTQRSVEIGG